MKKLFYVALIFLFSGCATIEEKLSGRMGCPPEEVRVIEDRNLSLSTRQFTAECRGQRFICTSEYSHLKGGDDLNCVKELATQDSQKK